LVSLFSIISLGSQCEALAKKLRSLRNRVSDYIFHLIQSAAGEPFGFEANAEHSQGADFGFEANAEHSQGANH